MCVWWVASGVLVSVVCFMLALCLGFLLDAM